MPPNHYKVEIIQYIDPHLIWINVITSTKDENFLFEQIGIDGILPHEITLDLETNIIIKNKCKQWAPAAAYLMKEFFLGAKEIWFSPTYIARGSVFDNNMHKFGEITIITADGEVKKISERLVEQGFAVYDEYSFSTDLINDSIKTKLSCVEMKKLLKCIKKYCSKNYSHFTEYNIVSKLSDKSQQILQLEIKLSKLNLERNNSMYENLLKNKIKDLAWCNESDEEGDAMGRGFTSKSFQQEVETNDKAHLKSDKKEYMFDRLQKIKENSKVLESTNLPSQNICVTQNIASKDNRCNEKAMRYLDYCKRKAQQTAVLNKGNTNMIELRKCKVDNSSVTTSESTDQQCSNSGDCKSSDGSISNVHKNKTSPELETTVEEKTQIRSPALQKHLNIYKKIIKKKDTDVLDTSKQDTSDEEVDDLIKKINIEYPKTNLVTKVTKKQNLQFDYDNNIKLISSNTLKSNIWDRLAAPLVMVHSKSKKVIKSIFAMRDIPFNNHIKSVLKKMYVEHIMKIQSISWKTILRGHSCILIGPRESGKTIGYLPSICRLVSDGTPEINNSLGPICIIVCATVCSVTEVGKLAKIFLGLDEKVLTCYSGVDNMLFTTSLLNGCDLLISTPTSLVRILQSTEFGIDLTRFRTLVIDDCERICETYNNEIKFIKYKVRELEKSRANKELKVQYVLASRIWCSFMERLAKKAPDTVIGISAYQECILYSKTNMTVSFVEKENKAKAVVEFLRQTDKKKAVIVCIYDEEVALLHNELKCLKRYIFTCNNEMDIGEFYQLSLAWNDYEDPLVGPVLICTDDNLSHLSITDAHYLVHYSLPKFLSMFNKRFAVLINNIPSMFSTERCSLKVKVFLDEQNTDNLPKILHFIKRCTDNVPSCLDDICQKVIKKKDFEKAKHFVNICEGLLNVGHCPDMYYCEYRHTIIKDFDEPKQWLPKSGMVTFKILHYNSAVSYSARLLTHCFNGDEKRYPQSYNTVTIKLGMYFGKASNRKLHGIPKPGDICAVSVKSYLFERCQVIKILSYCQRGNPKYVLIKLLDEEKYERTRDICLYHLPNEFKDIETYVVEVRLANVRPKDKDVTFSELARDEVKKVVDSDDNLYLRSYVAGAIGNIIFVDSLEVCQDLSSLDEIVVRYNLKNLLLEKHADICPQNLIELQSLCERDNFIMSEKSESIKFIKATTKNVGDWAYLDMDELSDVFIASIITPEKLFVRLSKFESCMKLLLNDIQTYISSKPTPLKEVEVGDIVIAKFPDDSIYERARVDSVENDKINCFFVDQGDWRLIQLEDMYAITDILINQFPFQSIECSLFGVKPPGRTWTDFSINWFHDHCREDDAGNLKHLFAKIYSKERAEFTGGNKYAIALIDTNTDEDIIINELMITLNLAQDIDSEIQSLDTFNITSSENTSAVDEDVCLHVPKTTTENISNTNVPLSKVFLPIPKRSVPLVESDCDSDISDEWQFNMTDDFLSIFKPVSISTNDTVSSLPSITYHDSQSDNETKKSSDYEIISKTESELDSEYTSTFDTSALALKNNINVIHETRKPKLIWHQNKANVIIQIQLIGVESYNLTIKDRSIRFETFHHDTNYNFEFDLYAVIDKRKSTHSNKGQYIYMKLFKVLQKNWLALTKVSDEKWILYNVDALDVSCDEENVDESIVNVVKEMINNEDSDDDDVNYKYE